MRSELHTKYRPGEFSDVLGQDGVCESIEEALEKGLGRSFILTGPSGVGKTTIARIIGNVVGAKGSDLIEVDAATRTGVDSVRELQETVRYRSMSGGGKLLILDEAHMLTKAAWNALLKVIEEPPPGVYWCFCTTDASRIPETIKTRCLCYDLALVQDDEIFGLLEKVCEDEDLELDDKVLDLVATKSQGSPRKALTMLSVVSDCEDRKEAALLLREAGEDKDSVALCRELMSGTDWVRVCKLLTKIDANPESIRRVVVAYFTKVALGAKSTKKAELALAVLDAFATPYPDQSVSHLLLSLGELLL